MKKVLLFLTLFVVFFVTPVCAFENKLYFTEFNDRIYYKSKFLDEDVFMKHLDMVPGKIFTDELIIENGTNTKYTLFFKVVPRVQSEEADNLLENIYMTIIIDGEEIYEGRATGLDYTDRGINLQDAILLGEFDPSKESKMVVETKLSEHYDNTEYDELSYIDWSFYAQYENSEPTEIVSVPNTLKNSFPIIFIVSICVILIGLFIILYARKKED